MWGQALMPASELISLWARLGTGRGATVGRMTDIPLGEFRRDRPFYPLVVEYITTLHGWLELASRGLGLVLEAAASSAEIDAQAAQHPGWPIRELASGVKTPLLQQLALDEKNEQAQGIHLDADDIAREVRGNLRYLDPFMERAAEHLMIVAYDTTEAFRTVDPIWEFLRHCRNAAAHGGRFRFPGGEPRRPAEWGGFALHSRMEGHKLFDSPPGNIESGLLGLGDPIRLVWDLEQTYPEMST
jgi:hypothetical protein